MLQSENIFVTEMRPGVDTDIRPLNIVILNLMPTEETTETQLMRLIGNTPLQVDCMLLHPKTHRSKNTPVEHLETFYKTFDDIRDNRFDGMIITRSTGRASGVR